MIKSADWFVESAEEIGLAFKVSPFIIGVTVVALGTSFSELIALLFAVFRGTTEIVIINVLGSNIANILLIVGLLSVVARSKRYLLYIDKIHYLMTFVTFVP